MKITIGARQSDLARLQAYLVGNRLKVAHPNLEITYSFREAKGDTDLTSPLWKMPDKGVFTADLSQDLIQGKVELVVHSWKDLPVEESQKTVIAATLDRADPRDVLLFKKAHWPRVKVTSLRVMTSSPRRQYNLAEFLPWAWPYQKCSFQFDPVRGNIQTRLRKFMEDDECSAFVLAKAALDRLVSTDAEEFQSTRAFVRQTLDECLFMVLPLKENPTAAAQGALAVEIRKEDTATRELLKAIDRQQDFANVMKERQLLASYGGGCHQKIGATVFTMPFGQVLSLRGLTDAGQKLSRWELSSSINVDMPRAASRDFVFPLEMADAALYDRSPVPVDARSCSGHDLFIAKANAFPDTLSVATDTLVWVSGSHTWRKLAARGVWVSGSCEALGEHFQSDLEPILGRPPRWLKLTHDQAISTGLKKTLATYAVKEVTSLPDLSRKTHFFWASYASFQQAQKAFPEAVRSGFHGVGPGHSYDKIRKALGDKGLLKIYLSFQDWKNDVLPTE